MKTLRACSIAATLMAVAGCASTPLQKADVDGRIVCNSDKMAQVERDARRHFTEVHWLNCPQAVLRAG
jgi:hypothetical protein